MSLIDVTIEKPALKRTDVVEATDETETKATDERPADTSNSVGRPRRTVGALGVIVAGAVGLVTLRKLRARRKKGSTDVSTE